MREFRRGLRSVCLVLPVLLTAAPVRAQSPDPDAARFITEDIDRFWEAFDAASPEFEPGAFQRLYLDRGTDGLEDFVTARIQSAEDLAAVVRSHPRYYASIRGSTGRVRGMEPAIRAAFYALKYLYPEAVFPDVYFLIGRMNSAGTTSARGLLIGVEMHGRTPEMPAEELGDWHRQVLKPVQAVPHIVAHELIHYQQRYPKGERTLLAGSIGEGVADFIAELISGRHINQHIHDWASTREAELWEEFRGRMGGTDFSGWLYDGDGADGRPADLGYWMGYRIARASYERAADKRRAVADMLNIEDFEAFLERSGYAEEFEE